MGRSFELSQEVTSKGEEEEVDEGAAVVVRVVGVEAVRITSDALLLALFGRLALGLTLKLCTVRFCLVAIVFFVISVVTIVVIAVAVSVTIAIAVGIALVFAIFLVSRGFALRDRPQVVELSIRVESQREVDKSRLHHRHEEKVNNCAEVL